MQATSSSKKSITTVLVPGEDPQPIPLFVCIKDKTIPFMTFEIKDQKDVNITMHCSNSSHTTTESYKHLVIKSKHQPNTTQEKKNKCIDHEAYDAVGYCEQEQEYLCQWCINNHQRCFPDHLINREEDQFVKVEYLCKEHRNIEPSFYCNTCQINTCVECKLKTHQAHDTFPVEDLLKDTNIQEWMKSMSQLEQGYYNDIVKKYKAVQKQLNSAYEGNIRRSGDWFGIVKSCLGMFEQYKDSYDINLYRNTANIVNNFNLIFLKTLWDDNNQGSALSISETIDYFSKQLILDISNIHLPNQCFISTSTIWPSDHPLQMNSQREQPKDTPLKELKRKELQAYVNSLCKLNNSQFAVGCANPNNIFIVDVNTLEIIRTLKHHTNYVCRLYLHRKTRNLLSLSGDCLICVWNYSNGKLIKELKGHINCVHGVVEWNNGDIITACWSGLIKYWNMRKYQCYLTIENSGFLNDVILKANNWITGGTDGIKYFKENAKDKDDYIYSIGCEGRVVCSLWLLEDDRWWAGCKDGIILIYDSNTCELQGELKGHSENVYSLILLSNEWVASGSVDFALKIWDWKTKECKQTRKLGVWYTQDDVNGMWIVLFAEVMTINWLKYL